MTFFVQISFAQNEDYFERYTQEIENSLLSPNSWAFSNQIAYPEVNSTGMINIEVPVYSLKDKDLNLDIKLNYNPNNLAVDNMATWVGTGWNLQCGGVITRQVRDKPDDVGIGLNDYWWIDLNRPVTHPPAQPNWWLGGKEPATSSLSNKIKDFPQTGWYGTIDPTTDPEGALGWSINFYGHNQTDLEPDIFTVNINGESFKFVFNEVREPKILNGFNDYIIEYQQEENGDFSTESIEQYPQSLNGQAKALIWFDRHIKSFTITSPTVYKYYFEEDDIEYTTQYIRILGATGQSIKLIEQEMPPHATAWYLSRIRSPNGNEITIDYDTEEMTFAPPISLHAGACEDGGDCISSDEDRYKFDPRDHLTEFIDRFIDDSPPYIFERRYNNYVLNFNVPFEEMLDRRTRSKIGMKFVSEIRTDNVKITFNSTHDGTPELNEIKVFDRGTSDLVKSFYFAYTYETDVNAGEDIPDDWTKRLFLKSFSETTGGVANAIIHSFEYSNVKLPHRHSKAQDAWGYFNNKDHGSLIPAVYVYPNQTGINRYRLFPIASSIDNHFYYLPGANRYVDNNFITAGTLKKIVFPTGGYRLYEFESNDYWDDKGQTNIQGGGLRIKSITHHNDVSSDNDIVKNYTYKKINEPSQSSGKIVYPPIYANETNFYLPKGAWRPEVVISTYGYPSWSGTEEAEWDLFTKRSSHSFNSLTDNHGNSVYYTDIKESLEPSSGYIDYKFHDPQSIENSKPEVVESRSLGCDYCDFIIDPILYSNNGNQPDHELYRMRRGNEGMSPFSPISDLNPSSNLLSGKLKSKYIYKQGLSNPIEKREYAYIIHGYNQEFVYGLVKRVYDVTTANTLEHGFSQGRGWNAISRYQYATNQVALIGKVTTTEYGTEEPTEGMVTDELFTYTPRNTLIRSVEKVAHPISSKNVYRYPFDVTGYGSTPYSLNFDVRGFWGWRDQNRISEPLQVVNYYYRTGETPKVVSGYMMWPMSVHYFPTPSSGYYVGRMFKLKLSEPVLSIVDLKITDISDDEWEYDYRYKEEVIFDDYDNYGNVLQFHEIHDINKSYIWGYNDCYPIITAENIDITNLKIAVNSIQSDMDSFLKNTIGDLTSSAQKSAWYTFNTSLRNHASLTNVFIKTYTYKPLIGITSETDIKGESIYYEYDVLNRLKLIKDHDGNILKQYEYHYHNQ